MTLPIEQSAVFGQDASALLQQPKDAVSVHRRQGHEYLAPVAPQAAQPQSGVAAPGTYGSGYRPTGRVWLDVLGGLSRCLSPDS